MSYILITGASSGIGQCFAQQLARQGCNLVLVARRGEKLAALAQELQDKHNIKVLILPCDLAAANARQQLYIQLEQADINLSGLINNAGLGAMGRFAEVDYAPQQQMLNVNIIALVELTHHIIPKLKQQPGSFIINVASTAAFQAGPGMAIYYASKAFVLSFSEALHEELKTSQIQVQALCPGATATEFADVAHMHDTKLFRGNVMTADAVVSESLAKRDHAIVVNGWINFIFAFGTRLTPRFITRKIAGWLNGDK